jgi:hypothetical protein
MSLHAPARCPLVLHHNAADLDDDAHDIAA